MRKPRGLIPERNRFRLTPTQEPVVPRECRVAACPVGTRELQDRGELSELPEESLGCDLVPLGWPPRNENASEARLVRMVVLDPHLGIAAPPKHRIHSQPKP